MKSKHYRAGILGAGFISEYHAKAIAKQKNSTLVAVCDMNEAAAKGLAAAYSAETYTDLDCMLREAKLDVVHVLTQPDSHFALTKKVLEAGCHAIVEKPVTINSNDAKTLAEIAEKNQRAIAINHNFVFSRPFNKLKDVLEQGTLGPLKSIRILWKKGLPPIHVGPWNLWMIREPGNILFETGSHSLSELLAVIGNPTIDHVDVRRPKLLPSGSLFYRRWSIAASAGPVSIHIDTAFDQGYEQHSVEVEGMFGVALADIENDVFVLNAPTGRAYDSERFHINVNTGLARAKQAFKTYSSYIASKFIRSASGAPYETSMLNGIHNCYRQIDGNATRIESSIEYAISIAEAAENIQARLPAQNTSAHQPACLPTVVSEPQLDAKVLIVGASGFIGKRLLVELQNRGVKVRGLVRNPSSLTGIDFKENCEIMAGDFRNRDISEKALQGVDTVFHLAVAHANSLQGYLDSHVEPTKIFIEQCKAHEIKRFVYTGTIDSLYLGPGAGKVKESDGIDIHITRRNNYAHSKSIAEDFLNSLYKNEQFPVVIVRPAIVLGAGGPVNHVGVANWSGLGMCSFWGDGKNNLPLVLVDDIVDGLIKVMETTGIEGNTYNLSAESCLSAQDYVREVEDVLGTRITITKTHYLKHYAGDMVKWIIKKLAKHPDAKRQPSIRDWRCREQHASFDTSKAQQDLGWQPCNDRNLIIEKGIREPARLFLENY